MSTGRRNFWLDVVLAILFVVAIDSGLAMWMIDVAGPAIPFLGRTLHIWQHIHGLTVMFMVIGVIVHLLWHWKWVKAAFRPGLKPQQVKINRMLDVLLFISFNLVMLSGLSSHGEGHAAAAAQAQVNSVRVDPFHLLTGIGLLLIVLVHQALHWKWIMATARKTTAASEINLWMVKMITLSGFPEWLNQKPEKKITRKNNPVLTTRNWVMLISTLGYFDGLLKIEFIC